MHSLLRTLILSISLAATCAHAGVIAYEPFDVPAGESGGEINPSSPVSGGTGLTISPMKAKRSPVTITSDSLTFSEGNALAVKGRAAQAPNGSSWIYKLNLDDLPADLENLRDPNHPSAIGAPGTSVWFSFLMRVDGAVTNHTEARLNLGKNRMMCGLTGNEKSDGAYIRLSGPRSDIAVESGTTYLIVGKITYGQKSDPDERTDNVEIWVNPSIGNQDPDRPADTHLDGTLATLEDFWFETNSDGNTQAVFDEIRIGDTYKDVTPQAH